MVAKDEFVDFVELLGGFFLIKFVGGAASTLIYACFMRKMSQKKVISLVKTLSYERNFAREMCYLHLQRK